MSTSNRITYTPDGFRRRMKMSPDAALFIIVEGRETDHWFYERLASTSRKLTELGYQVWRIESFSVKGVKQADEPGGKDAVLELREKILRIDGLSVQSRYGTRSVMFCVDADHDRLAKTQVKCRHVTYTQLPDAEAHILDSVDVGELVAAVMSLSEQRKRELLSTLGDYRSRLAEKWADWFQLCCLSGRINATNGPRPGTPGTAIKTSYAKIVKRDLAAVKRSVIATSKCSPPEIARIEKAIEDEIRSLIACGESRQLIKGKWLGEYLVFEANKYAKPRRLKQISKSEIHAAARASAIFRNPWLSYFRRRATALV